MSKYLLQPVVVVGSLGRCGTAAKYLMLLNLHDHHCGFKTANYFHEVFKKQTGLTPTEWLSQG